MYDITIYLEMHSPTDDSDSYDWGPDAPGAGGADAQLGSPSSSSSEKGRGRRKIRRVNYKDRSDSDSSGDEMEESDDASSDESDGVSPMEESEGGEGEGPGVLDEGPPETAFEHVLRNTDLSNELDYVDILTKINFTDKGTLNVSSLEKLDFKGMKLPVGKLISIINQSPNVQEIILRRTALVSDGEGGDGEEGGGGNGQHMDETEPLKKLFRCIAGTKVKRLDVSFLTILNHSKQTDEQREQTRMLFDFEDDDDFIQKDISKEEMIREVTTLLDSNRNIEIIFASGFDWESEVTVANPDNPVNGPPLSIIPELIVPTATDDEEDAQDNRIREFARLTFPYDKILEMNLSTYPKDLEELVRLLERLYESISNSKLKCFNIVEIPTQTSVRIGANTYLYKDRHQIYNDAPHTLLSFCKILL